MLGGVDQRGIDRRDFKNAINAQILKQKLLAKAVSCQKVNSLNANEKGHR